MAVGAFEDQGQGQGQGTEMGVGMGMGMEMEMESQFQVEMQGWGVWAVVAPFECEWLVDEALMFREGGRGCVVFEAMADNDVTVVFREEAASKHCHYRRDCAPDYAVVLGSHRNRRWRIEAGGESVADVVGPRLCGSSLGFQSFWISIFDGLVSVGTGARPGLGVLLQWQDPRPRSKVRYVGLSSWDKHVGYRNVRVLPVPPACNPREMVVEELSGLEGFLGRWELADVTFVVGSENRVVPAHRIVLALCCSNTPLTEELIKLPSVDYEVLNALLQYMYTGHTKISVSKLGALSELSERFGLQSLLSRCDHFKNKCNAKSAGMDHEVELQHCNPFTVSQSRPALFSASPIDWEKLKYFLRNGDYNDLKIYSEGPGLVADAHKLVLSAWSIPFAKMFTNGMNESYGSEIYLNNFSPEVILLMLHYMYTGELGMDENQDLGRSLLPLLVLADEFGISLLQQECCEYLLECLSEDSVCSILQVVSSMPSCRSLEEACEAYFAKHFDYCTTSSREFEKLEKGNFMRILQHPDLAVTSEERVLDAVLTWGTMGGYERLVWEACDRQLDKEAISRLFGEQLESMNEFLPLVHFPLMPISFLKKLDQSSLRKHIPIFQHLIREALQYLESDAGNFSGIHKQSDKAFENSSQSWIGRCYRFHHRRSSYKHLLYICDGDHNGVIYYAGTSYGQHPWVNPVLSKMISVSASSPLSRYTDAKALVSRDYQPTSFAGPYIEDGKKTAWWKIDLGEGHQLMCNYYTIRQDGSTCYPRSWSFQGSLDGEHWTDLRKHENDHTICRPGQFASFPIHGAKAYLPFRSFRVALNEATSCRINPWNLCICYLEIYGYVK